MSSYGFRSDELKNIVKYVSIKYNEFEGIFPCDRFLKLIKDHRNNFLTGVHRFIVNLSSSNNYGSHWVVIIINTDHSVYFDSLGKYSYLYYNIECLFLYSMFLLSKI